MNRQFLLFAFFAFLLFQSVQAQKNYLGYYDLVNKAEEEFVVSNNKAECYKLYDKAFADYERPFAKDFFIASEIAYFNGDTIRFLTYIKKCFDVGMTFQCLHQAHLFDSLFTNKALIGKLNSLYESRHTLTLDTIARDSSYMRFYQEQVLKRVQGGETNRKLKEKENTEYFAQFLTKGIFPSEQLIGLYSEEGFNNFLEKFRLAPFENQFANYSSNNKTITTNFTAIPDDYDLWNKCAFVSFIHYPCAFFKYKNDFWKAVENGYVHPKDFAMLEEWFAKSIGNPNYLHDCMEERQPFYYNIIRDFSVTDTESLKKVEANRQSKHLQKYSVDILKKKMQTEKGINFFFGFLHYR